MFGGGGGSEPGKISKEQKKANEEIANKKKLKETIKRQKKNEKLEIKEVSGLYN
jgi:hypothetical protein